jgi:hypothetical protein
VLGESGGLHHDRRSSGVGRLMLAVTQHAELDEMFVQVKLMFPCNRPHTSTRKRKRCQRHVRPCQHLGAR